jgi:PGDYG protein
MAVLKNIDLGANSNAAIFEKHEIVEVTFAQEAGSLQSREGTNHYAIGDALITGSTGDCWSVTRDRFDAKYLPVDPARMGQNGHYANLPRPVLALRMSEDFSVERCSGGDVIHGRAGDWLMQYAPGDHGIVEAEKFSKVYRSRNLLQ